MAAECHVVAGVDVGNATTEVVLARLVDDGYLAAERCPTRGLKGSRSALDNAARLLTALEQRIGVSADLVLLAEQTPVLTADLPLKVPTRPGPLALLAAGAHTISGGGHAVGRACRLGSPPTAPGSDTAGPLVVLVPRSWDFEDAADAINALAKTASVVAVLVEADEARLIGNRLTAPVPVIDEVDIDAVIDGHPVAVEVAAPGRTVRRLQDPLWLAHHFQLKPAQIGDLRGLVRKIADVSSAAVQRTPGRHAEVPALLRIEADVASATRSGDTQPRQLLLPDDLEQLARVRPCSVRVLHASDQLPNRAQLVRARDLFAPPLADLGAGAWLREGVLNLDQVPLAALATASAAEPLATLAAEAFGRPALVVSSETEAAETGAATTPGAPPDVCVCDLGGGTVDVMWREHRVTAAGAGILLTDTVASLLGIGVPLAEMAKRSASVFVESPHLARSETGEKLFLGQVADARAIGQAAVLDGNTLHSIPTRLSVEEWRSVRLGLKRLILGTNLARCLDALPAMPSALLLAGGAASDHELAAAVAARLPDTVVASADVAGCYGVRYAVAVGVVKIFRERHASWPASDDSISLLEAKDVFSITERRREDLQKCLLSSRLRVMSSSGTRATSGFRYLGDSVSPPAVIRASPGHSSRRRRPG
jgi:hypothetical protein